MSVPIAQVTECLPMFGKTSARQEMFCQLAATLYTNSDDITLISSVGTVRLLESDRSKHNAHRTKFGGDAFVEVSSISTAWPLASSGFITLGGPRSLCLTCDNLERKKKYRVTTRYIIASSPKKLTLHFLRL
jgi:hypothetical protein